MGLLCILDRGIQIRRDLLSTLLVVADPISLDVLVYFGPRLRFRARNVPEMAQSLKIELLLQFSS